MRNGLVQLQKVARPIKLYGLDEQKKVPTPNNKRVYKAHKRKKKREGRQR